MKPFVITKSQILHLITTFILVPLAGYITSWVARHFPGLPHFTSGEVTAFFVTGASAALGSALHYLHGWQVWERTIGRIVDINENAVAKPGPSAGV